MSNHGEENHLQLNSSFNSDEMLNDSSRNLPQEFPSANHSNKNEERQSDFENDLLVNQSSNENGFEYSMNLPYDRDHLNTNRKVHLNVDFARHQRSHSTMSQSSFTNEQDSHPNSTRHSNALLSFVFDHSFI